VNLRAAHKARKHDLPDTQQRCGFLERAEI